MAADIDCMCMHMIGASSTKWKHDARTYQLASVDSSENFWKCPNSGCQCIVSQGRLAESILSVKGVHESVFNIFLFRFWQTKVATWHFSNKNHVWIEIFGVLCFCENGANTKKLHKLKMFTVFKGLHIKKVKISNLQVTTFYSRGSND